MVAANGDPMQKLGLTNLMLPSEFVRYVQKAAAPKVRAAVAPPRGCTSRVIVRSSWKHGTHVPSLQHVNALGKVGLSSTFLEFPPPFFHVLGFHV